MMSFQEMLRMTRNAYLRVRMSGVSQLRIEIQRAILDRYIEYKIKSIKSSTRRDYSTQPLCSAVVQFYNKRRMIRPIIDSLRESGFDEIIIIDDGSIDRSGQDFKNILTRPNEFVISSNDIYEVRTYQRALKMTNAEFVCLLQDDDIPASNSGWIDDAIKLFDNFDDLIILGGRTAIAPRIPDNPNEVEDLTYQIDGQTAGKPGVNKYKKIPKPTYSHEEIDFMFVPVVNRAPMWVRRDTFLDTGGIDKAFTPYQCDDVDSCLRSWNKQYKVGLYNPSFKRIAESAMSAHNPMSEREEIITNSWNIIYKRYGMEISESKFDTMCKNANEVL